MSIKYMNIKEFREKGFLQEANRLFFHPLGLALEIEINVEDRSEKISGVWDYRDDPEGVLFGEDMLSPDKAQRINELRMSKQIIRHQTGKCYEDGIQKIPERKKWDPQQTK